jgi:hypothetical protein
MSHMGFPAEGDEPEVKARMRGFDLSHRTYCITFDWHRSAPWGATVLVAYHQPWLAVVVRMFSHSCMTVLVRYSLWSWFFLFLHLFAVFEHDDQHRTNLYEFLWFIHLCSSHWSSFPPSFFFILVLLLPFFCFDFLSLDVLTRPPYFLSAMRFMPLLCLSFWNYVCFPVSDAFSTLINLVSQPLLNLFFFLRGFW